MSDVVLKENYDCENIYLTISLPICLNFRIHSLYAHLEQLFPLNKIDDTLNHMSLLKDCWRSVVGPQLANITGKVYISRQHVDFIVNVSFGYEEDSTECSKLSSVFPEELSIRETQHRKYADQIISRSFVDDNCSKESFKKELQKIPSEPKEPLFLKSIECNHNSIYLAGRYNKFSRELPQTPWHLNDRNFCSSIQEIISSPVLDLMMGKDLKFSASGREDVDVRCLGNGRPFILEVFNPHRTKHSKEKIKECQSVINSLSEFISIRDLQLVKKDEVSKLKSGEEEKTKSYCALCHVKDHLKEDDLEPIKSVKDLVLHQATPLRVLQRRSLAIRDRKIIQLTSEFVNEHSFKIYLTAEAGTYIKEFVHGDFGRTKPNLKTILGFEVDILALDVTGVHLDWPPALDDLET